MSPRLTVTSARLQLGAAAVELALLTVPLIIMTLVAFEFARGIYHYNVLVQATRDAARMLSGFDPSITAEYPTTPAVDRVLYGPGGAGDKPLVPNITGANVQICNSADSTNCPGMSFSAFDTTAGTISLVRVQVVNYQYQPWFPGANVFGDITYGTIGTTMRNQ